MHLFGCKTCGVFVEAETLPTSCAQCGDPSMVTLDGGVRPEQREALAAWVRRDVAELAESQAFVAGLVGGAALSVLLGWLVGLSAALIVPLAVHLGIAGGLAGSLASPWLLRRSRPDVRPVRQDRRARKWRKVGLVLWLVPLVIALGMAVREATRPPVMRSTAPGVLQPERAPRPATTPIPQAP